MVEVMLVAFHFHIDFQHSVPKPMLSYLSETFSTGKSIVGDIIKKFIKV